MSKRSTRKKEQEAQEMARLLDPSYQGASTERESIDHRHHRKSLEVYVDRDGDLHDPDFRYFPTADAFVSHSRRGDVRERERRRNSLGIRRRPYWEQETDYPFLSDEEEEEDNLARELGSTDFLTQAGHGNGTSDSETSAMVRSRRNRREVGSASFSSYFHPSSSASTNTHSHIQSMSYYSPTMTNSTLPTSYDSENTLLTMAEAEGEKAEKEGVSKGLGLLKRRKLGEKLEIMSEEEDSGVVQKEEEENVVETGEYVPTCTETLKRHWFFFCFRFRFGIYRSRRGFVRRVQSLF